MAQDLHTVAVIDGSQLARSDRLILAVLPQVAHGVGGGAGQPVSVAIAGLQLPAVYGVEVTASQDATVWVSARTQAGFTLNIAPRLAASTLVAGTLDVLVYA